MSPYWIIAGSWDLWAVFSQKWVLVDSLPINIGGFIRALSPLRMGLMKVDLEKNFF